MLPHFQASFRSAVGVNQKVLNSFVVDFKHGKVNFESFVCCGKLFYPRENLITGYRNDSDVLAISDLKYD